jgi:hypothetical protein
MFRTTRSSGISSPEVSWRTGVRSFLWERREHRWVVRAPRNGQLAWCPSSAR